MPIYEYQCQLCDLIFDRFQKINEPPPTNCPDCNGEKIKKLISMSSFHLKGTGWYATDYKSGSSNGSKNNTKLKSPSSDSTDKDSSQKDSVKSEVKSTKVSSAEASV